MYVIENTSPVDIPAAGGLDPRRAWVGPDDRDVELEIVAVVLPAERLVIHVMPTSFRRTR